MSSPRSPFICLPAELHLHIACYLPFGALVNLLRCNHHTHSLLSPLVIRRAVRQTIDPKSRESSDRSPLHAAAATHNIPLLTTIITICIKDIEPGRLSHKLSIFNCPDGLGMTPLLSAIIAPFETPPDRVKTIALLLRHGATPEYRGLCRGEYIYGDTPGECSLCCRFPPPLWYAVVFQEYEIMSLLLVAGANAGTPPLKHNSTSRRWSWAPLYIALLRRDARAVKILLHEGKMEEEAWSRPMHWAFERWREGWEDMKPIFREWLGEDRWEREFPRPEYRVLFTKSMVPMWDDRILKCALESECSWRGRSWRYPRIPQLMGGTVAEEQEWPGEGCNCGCGAPKPHPYLVRGHRGWWTWRPEFR